ncbi:MAG: response regulator [candidate division Zixibacteria bacterium]|nr:response regulator [candidate division Zixibacteria bacterium]
MTQKLRAKIEGARILVVDDDPDLTEIIKTFLEGSGYHVTTENSATRSLEIAKTIKPDLVLLDITMPDKDGYNICMELKKEPTTAHIPVVFLTGKDVSEDNRRSFKVGADLFIKKPFSCESLLEIVRIVLMSVSR